MLVTIAPSWSWLSVTTPVDFIIRYVTWAEEHDRNPNVILVQCKEAIVKTVGGDLMGQVGATLSCSVILDQPMSDSQRVLRLHVNVAPDGSDSIRGTTRMRDSRGSWYCVLAYRDSCYDEDFPVPEDITLA